MYYIMTKYIRGGVLCISMVKDFDPFGSIVYLEAKDIL